MPLLSSMLTSPPLSLLMTSFDFLTRTTWGTTTWTKLLVRLAIGPSEPRSIDIEGSSVSDGHSRSRFDAWKTRCLLLMWKGGCVSADWRRRELWCAFRQRCRVIGKLFVCLRGLWNVGVCPEKGMMLQLRRKYLVSAVMTTRAESRISHGLLVVRSCTRYLSADVALVSIVFGYHMYLR
jgi:hypothetical protein